MTILSYVEPSSEALQIRKEQLHRDFTSFVELTNIDLGKLLHQFNSWWLWRGPTNFHTTDDAFRYKKELYSFILANLETVNGDTNAGAEQVAVADSSS